MLAEQFQEVIAFASTVLGALPEPGLSAGRPDIRTQEVAIGNTVCDAMLAALKNTVRSPAMRQSAYAAARVADPSSALCLKRSVLP